MANGPGTFKRTEKKYLLDADQRPILVAAAAGALVPDAFGRSLVSSLYFDTAERSLIARSVEKPLYKEKLRLRWYGPDAPEAAFVELKKKCKGVVYKRRVALSPAAAEAYLAGMPFSEAWARFPLGPGAPAQPTVLDRQIAREVDALRRRRRPLRPSALIRCQRTAWAEPSPLPASNPAPDALRITLDDQLACADLLGLAPADALRDALAGRIAAHPLTRRSVLEVKACRPYPRWLIDALNRARAYPQPFSKYGEMYRAAAAAPTERTIHA